MANKQYIEFEGFDEAVKRITDLEGDVKKVTEKALKETHKVITEKAQKAIHPHWDSGNTEKSLKRDSKVVWAGTLASIETGFDLSDGGMPSVFLMYGTPKHGPVGKKGGHPGTDKDQKLYNAFFGAKTKKEIKELQEKIFFDEIRRLNG